ncbi:MAG: hypothetical protein ACI3ZR_03675 [bacterium]
MKNFYWKLAIAFFLFFMAVSDGLAYEIDNTLPIARFSVEKRFLDLNEKVIYHDESYDPDGDTIVEWDWQGREDYFSEPGEKNVTLRVKDSRGLWSKPYTVNLMVREPKIVDSFTVLMNSSPIGKRLDFTGEEPLSFQLLSPERVRYGGPTLLLSDSPETLKENGILYADNALGNVRLFYYHENGIYRPKRVVVIAENMEEDKMVKLNIMKEAAAGPSKKGVLLGQQGVLRYFKSGAGKSLSLEPGQAVVINQLAKVDIPYKHITHEVMDVYTDGLVRFTYLALEPGIDPLLAYRSDLKILLRDNHPRGTFLNADRYLEINVADKGKKRISFGDNKTDQFQTGVDNLTGLPSINHGNYGVLYTVAVKSPHRLGAALVMKGGPYAGAVISTDGKIHAIPTAGVIYPIIHGAKVAVFPATDYYFKKIKFMVPVASSTPIDLLMIHLDENNIEEAEEEVMEGE